MSNTEGQLRQFTYRISDTLDPEERLEDAAMAKAMHDAFQGRLKIVSDKKGDFGRDRFFEGPRDAVPYWDNHWAFVDHCAREFYLCDVKQAEEKIADLHSRGKGAFVKAVDTKLFALPVPIGTSLYDAVGDLIYSVIDRPPCIMVQELCRVEWEQRFVVVGGKVVTSSPVATHLTPAHRLPPYAFFETPSSRDYRLLPGCDLTRFAEMVAKRWHEMNVIIDCAYFNHEPGVIEFNPFSIGNFGLYNCDPFAIAEAYYDFVVAEEKMEELENA